MTAEKLKNWLKEKLKLESDQIAVGAIDGNAEQYIGVYDGKSSSPQRMCIGGKRNTKYQESSYTLLVHWSTSPVTAYAKAKDLYDLFYGLSDVDMDGIHVIMVDPGKQPELAGRDDRRVCEYVIRLNIKYERIDDNG